MIDDQLVIKHLNNLLIIKCASVYIVLILVLKLILSVHVMPKSLNELCIGSSTSLMKYE